MSDGRINVLFVCRENSARSIMAEALLNRFSNGRFHAFSCGLTADPVIDPHTIETLSANGLPTQYLRSRRIGEFLEPSAPQMDFVINLCDEPLPLEGWRGNPFFAHWGITDPLAERSEPHAERIAFRRAFRELETRIRLFVVLRHQVPASAAAAA